VVSDAISERGGLTVQSGATHRELKVLQAHGWSVSRLAREFGLSRTTIRRELASAEPRRYPARRQPTALSDAQCAHAERRLAMCPTLRGSVLYHELFRDYAYRGSYPAFIRHLRALRPVALNEPVVRFETAPGIQVQADWGHLGVWPLEDGVTELFGLVAILHEVDDRRREVDALIKLGGLVLSVHRFEEAHHYFEQALALARAMGDLEAEGAALHGLGLLAENQGQADMARKYYEQALAVYVAIESRDNVQEMRALLAAVSPPQRRRWPFGH
jgi:tetratricopeptide (TPR) repeat protein